MIEAASVGAADVSRGCKGQGTSATAAKARAAAWAMEFLALYKLPKPLGPGFGVVSVQVTGELF